MMSEAATKQVATIRTHVRLLRPGKLAADIAFNPSGPNISDAADQTAASPLTLACGYSSIGSAYNSGGGSSGVGIPKRHVVAVVRVTITSPGTYTLTFTLNQRGRKILARVGAADRAYRKSNPHGNRPPTITWGVGIHFATSY